MKYSLTIIGILVVACSFYASGQSVDSSLIPLLKTQKAFLRSGKKAGLLTVSIEKIFVQEAQFWMGFRIRNRSGLSYPIELFRLFIRDKERTRRSSVQELELIPLYTDTILSVPAKASAVFLIVIAKFTIPDNKVCVLELFETNGGRNLSLELTNRQLFLAKPIPHF